MILVVTQVHVDKALANPDPFSGGCCPVAQAFMDHFQTKDVYAMIDKVRVGTRYYHLSADLATAIGMFFRLDSSGFHTGEYEIWI